MRMIDREAVEGTWPVIHIGRRTYKHRRTHRERVSRRWYAEYCLEGTSQYESLRTTVRALAVKAAHAIVQRIEAGHPKCPARRTELAALTTTYLEMLRNRGRAPRTLQKYAAVLDSLVAYASCHAIRWATAFGETDFWAFHQTMVDKGLAPKTRYGDLTIVKQLFKWGARTRRMLYNPLVDATLERPPLTLQPCFLPEQVGALLDAADGQERAVFALMAYTGLRFGEVRDLRWCDLLLDQGRHGFLTVQRGGSGGTTKNKRVRLIPIHPTLRKILDALPHDSGRVFVAGPSKRHPTGGSSLNERHVLGLLKCLCARCGFSNPDQYKLHTFRHAFASMCARNNVSYKYALEWMGHTSSEILDLYYTMYDDAAQEAIVTIDYPLRHGNVNVPVAWWADHSRGLAHEN